MGQRLNLEIIDGDENNVLANAYYHWSAYTTSAASLAWNIVNAIEAEDFLYEYDDKLTAIRLLEKTGAGFNESEREWIKNNAIFPEEKFKDAVDRNTGLLAISPNGIDETRKYEEGRVSIDINSKRVYFSVFFVESPSDFEEYHTTEVPLSKLPVSPVDPSYDLSFEEFLAFCEFLSKLNNFYFTVRGRNDIFCMIA
jgi:hypothetical protein